MADYGRLPPIAGLTADRTGWGFFLCARKEVRQGRGGEAYLALVLQDRTGTLSGRVFTDASRLGDEFDAGEFVKAQGRVDLFNGRLQLLIERIRRVHADQDRAQGFREEDCVLSAPRSADEMWAELESLVQQVRDTHIRALLQSIIARHADKLRVWPAAQTVHHAYRAGFLEHVLGVARAALVLGTAYGADRDLLTAGAILHDIGKLEELAYDQAIRYTRDGNLVGHVTLGAIMVRAAIAEIPDFPDVLRSQIEHLVVSHHGHKEFGAPVEPMSLEAVILAAADDLDAKVNQMKRAFGEEPDGEFTAYQPRFGRALWRG